MVRQEMMDPHPEMSLHQKVRRLQEMMLALVKNPLRKVQMRANRLQRLLQMGRLRQMGLLLETALLQEMRLLQEIPLHLLGLLLVMLQKLKHLQERLWNRMVRHAQANGFTFWLYQPLGYIPRRFQYECIGARGGMAQQSIGSIINPRISPQL